MNLSKTGNADYPLLFTFKYSPQLVNTCRLIKDKFGFVNFRYDGNYKGWLSKWICFEEIQNCFPHINIPPDLIEEYKAAAQDQILKITSKDQELEIDLPLFDYQKRGVNFAYHNKKCFNNDEMGLGKSLQSIAIIKHLDLKNVLIICPNSLKPNWKREVRKWINKEAIIVEESIINDRINIINYEKLSKFILSNDDPESKKIKLSPEINKIWDLIILDESHYIKEGKSKRTKISSMLCKLSDRVILLTGTPMLNKPKELIPQIKAIDRMGDFGTEWNFLNRYCDPKHNGFGTDFNGASNIEELKVKLEQFSIRRLKKDVLKDLPDKMINNILIDIHEPKVYNKLERELRQELLDTDDKYKNFYKDLAGKSKEERSEVIVKSKMEGQFKNLTTNVLTMIEKLKQESARQKVIASAELLNSYRDSKTKTVVFCTHKKTVRDLSNSYFQNSVMITGDIKPEDRIKALDMFENSPDIYFVFATMATVGTGFNITCASNVLFMELGWTPAEHKQCEDRCWRIGQVNKVFVNYLIAKDTIDEDIIEILNSKSEIIENTVVGELLNKLILKPL